MQAFQDGYPDLVVLLTFGYSLPHATSAHGKKTLAKSRYGLLAPYLDGMVEAARGDARLVDGYELSYGYREPAQFARAYELMTRGVLPLVADKDKYRRVLSAGFGLWLDYDWRQRGWDAGHPDRNYFSPAKVEAAVRRALERSDEYVWVYSETPRWWSPEGQPVKLPEAYSAALRRARKGLAKE
jgi:hypothetical protein